MVLLAHGFVGIHSGSRIVADIQAVGRLAWSGVDLFFVLSGFLIGGILMDAKASPRYFTTFYARRAYRILPIYAIVLVSVYFLRYLPADISDGLIPRAMIPFATYVTFTQNFWMAALGNFGGGGLGVTWSLAIEEQFYLTAPLVVRRISRARLAYVLAAIVVLAPALRTWVILGLHWNHFAAFSLMPCRADALCLGMLSALLVRDSRAWEQLKRKRVALYWAAVGLLLVMAWLSYQGYRFNSTPMATFGYSVLGLFYTCCLLIALLKTPLVERALCNKWLIELGGISYCVYLIHQTMIRAGHMLVDTMFHRLGAHFSHAGFVSTLLGSLLGIAFAFAVAKVSWRFLEQPMLRRGHAYKY